MCITIRAIQDFLIFSTNIIIRSVFNTTVFNYFFKYSIIYMQPIIIKYNSGKINIEVKEFNQEIHLSKNQKLNGHSCIVNNTCWNDDMHQTIKPRESNYYLMSKNEFVNIEEPTLTTKHKNNTLIIQIVNIYTNVKQKNRIIKSENKHISQNQMKTKDNIFVEF